MVRGLGLLGFFLLACGAPSNNVSVAHVFTAVNEQHSGTYNLGPVAFHGSYWNSCAPYTPELETRIGDNLAGLALRFNGDGSLCDTCVQLKTSKGKSVTARVITTGETVGPNDIDLSQKAFEALGGDIGTRQMTWAIVKCSSTSDKIQYQFQTEANADWTSLWVRGARLPLTSLEVKSANHSSWVSLQRGTDGTLTDTSGFGNGKFMLRSTAYDGQIVTDSFEKFSPGGLLTSSSQFE